MPLKELTVELRSGKTPWRDLTGEWRGGKTRKRLDPRRPSLYWLARYDPSTSVSHLAAYSWSSDAFRCKLQSDPYRDSFISRPTGPIVQFPPNLTLSCG